LGSREKKKRVPIGSRDLGSREKVTPLERSGGQGEDAWSGVSFNRSAKVNFCNGQEERGGGKAARIENLQGCIRMVIKKDPKDPKRKSRLGGELPEQKLRSFVKKSPGALLRTVEGGLLRGKRLLRIQGGEKMEKKLTHEKGRKDLMGPSG